MIIVNHHAGPDPQERKQIEIEQEVWRSINALFDDKEKKYQKSLVEKEQALTESHKIIDEKERALLEKERENEFLKNQLSELMKKLGD